ncbi:hypothetical protein P0Y35_18590 [Kiritimatiellaeota bacterium B1221]|nr:hypothetical protein [Kiritimatiellaeota bacterium B1221]
MRNNLKNILILLSLGLSVSGWAADYYFTGASGTDFNWSTGANWSGGSAPVLTHADTVYIQSATAVVDSNYVIQKLVLDASVGSNATLSGAGTLTIDGNSGSNTDLIDNLAAVDFKLDGTYVLDNTASNNKANNIRASQNSGSVTFGENSSATLSDRVITVRNIGSYSFNGELSSSGSGVLYEVGGPVTFGSTSVNNSGVLQLKTNSADITVDTTHWLDGATDNLATGWSSSLTINVDDAVSNRPDLNIENNFTYHVNGDADWGTLKVNNGATRKGNFYLDPSVTALTFLDSSGENWGLDEELIIHGFSDGVIRFGTGSDALTTQMLSQITAYTDLSKTQEVTEGLTLDSDGYLVAIPEPTTLGMVLTFALAMFLGRRK